MSSNRYYREWKNNNSNYLHKLEKNNINRLDRAIDKIEIEESAKKIFEFGKQAQLSNQYQLNPFVKLQKQNYPIYYTPEGTQYIIINGYLVMY